MAAGKPVRRSGAWCSVSIVAAVVLSWAGGPERAGAQQPGSSRPPEVWNPWHENWNILVPPNDLPGMKRWMWGEATMGAFGCVGDVDGDGFMDAITGAPSGHGIQVGRVLIHKGPDLELHTDFGSAAQNRYGLFGLGVWAEDIDRDGCDEVYVFHPKPRNSAPSWIEVFDGDGGRTRIIELPYPGNGGWGLSPFASGDFDADGWRDLAVAYTFSATPDGGGSVCILYGPRQERVDAIHRPDDDVSHFATNVAVADFDGDGFDDVGTCDPLSDVGLLADIGRAWVYFGPDFQRSLEFINPDEMQRINFGWDLEAGDLDGDGFAEFIVGASRAANDPDSTYPTGDGVVWIYWGPDLLDEESWRVTNQPVEEIGGQFGVAMEVADMDEDGINDLLVGAPGVQRLDPNGNVAGGEVDILYGPDLSRWDRVHAPWIGQYVSAQLGKRVVAGDVSGDGTKEILCGNPQFDGLNGGVHVVDLSAGSSFVPYRSRGRRSATPALRLAGSGPTTPGSQFTVQVSGVRTGVSPVLWASASPDAALLNPPGVDGELPAGLRYLLLHEPVAFLGGMQPGPDRDHYGDPTWERSFRIPPNESLIGSRHRFQAFEYAADAPLGFRESNGLIVTVVGRER